MYLWIIVINFGSNICCIVWDTYHRKFSNSCNTLKGRSRLLKLSSLDSHTTSISHLCPLSMSWFALRIAADWYEITNLFYLCVFGVPAECQSMRISSRSLVWETMGYHLSLTDWLWTHLLWCSTSYVTNWQDTIQHDIHMFHTANPFKGEKGCHNHSTE